MNKNTLRFIIFLVLLAGIGYYFLRSHNNSTSTTNQSQSSITGKTANYSGRGLTKFPDQVLNDTSITVLNLSNNDLTGALPSQIQNLINLQELNVSNNQMTGIPAEVGRLNNLKILNYANNKITGLPNEIGNLTQLQLLDLRGNPNVSQHDLAEIRAKLTKTQIKL